MSAEQWEPEQYREYVRTGIMPRKPTSAVTVPAKARATKYGPRHVIGVMNGTESLYAELLTARHIQGEVQSWSFEAHTFRLAEGLRFTPDFEVVLSDGSIEYVDVKGSTKREAIDQKSTVKIKMAAKQFPHYRFVQEKRRSKADGGGFERHEF
jgi:hypothetical protein